MVAHRFKRTMRYLTNPDEAGIARRARALCARAIQKYKHNHRLRATLFCMAIAMAAAILAASAAIFIAAAAISRSIPPATYEQVMSSLRLPRASDTTRGTASPSCSVAVDFSGGLPRPDPHPSSFVLPGPHPIPGGIFDYYLAEAQVPSSRWRDDRDKNKLRSASGFKLNPLFYFYFGRNLPAASQATQRPGRHPAVRPVDPSPGVVGPPPRLRRPPLNVHLLGDPTDRRHPSDTPSISLLSSTGTRTQLIVAAQRCRGVLRTPLSSGRSGDTQQSWGILFPFRVELRSRSWEREPG